MYQKSYTEKQPIIDGAKVLSAYDEKLISIVHQYDRIPGLKEKIMEKFDD